MHLRRTLCVLVVCGLAIVEWFRPAAEAGNPSIAAGRAVVQTTHVESTPLIRVREVTSTMPWGDWVKTKMPLTLRQKYFMAFWPEARLRQHLGMLRAFGFNSIQVFGNPVSAWWVGADEQQWRQRQIFRCRTARDLGMSVSVFVWGAAVPDRTKGGQQFSHLAWDKPEERAKLQAWYQDQAELAPYADRVVTHWIDPGEQRNVPIETVIEQHNAILGGVPAEEPENPRRSQHLVHVKRHSRRI